MADNTLTIQVAGLPALVFEIRKCMANVLREEAESESDPRIARRLNEIAARFEVGTDWDD